MARLLRLKTTTVAIVLDRILIRKTKARGFYPLTLHEKKSTIELKIYPGLDVVYYKTIQEAHGSYQDIRSTHNSAAIDSHKYAPS